MKKKVVFAIDNGAPFVILAEDEPWSNLCRLWQPLGQRGTPLDMIDAPPGIDVDTNQQILNALALAWASGRQFQSAMGGNIAV